MIGCLRRCWLTFDRLMQPRVPAERLGLWRALVCLVALYDVLLYAPVVFGDAAMVAQNQPLRPWTPIYLFQVFGVQPIDTETAQLVHTAAVVALLCGAFGLLSRWSCAIGALLFYYWTGFAYSFGKPHHDKVALAFAIAALPFARVGAAVSLDACWRRFRGRRVDGAFVNGMPIRLAQFTLAFGYCGAGLSKLIIGGPDWFNGYTLQGIMLGHDGDWSRLFASSPLVCQIQSIGVVSVQAMFPAVLIWPKSRWFFLPAATGFHLMTWKTMDTGPYMRVWLLLFAFLPMESIPAHVWRWLRHGPVAPVATVLGIGAYTTLVGTVASNVVPIWALAALAALLLVWFVRGRPGHLPAP